MANHLKNLGIKILGILCLFFGLCTIWTPIPTGVILLAVGTALVLMTSKRAVRIVRRVRRRYPKIDQLLHEAEIQLPAKLAKTLRRTNVRIKSKASQAGNGLKSMRKKHQKINS